MRISDWSSDVCSSDLIIEAVRIILEAVEKHRRGRYLGLHPQHWLEHLPHSARQPFVQQVERVKLAEAALLVRSKGIGRDLAVRHHARVRCDAAVGDALAQRLQFFLAEVEIGAHRPSYWITKLVK